MPKYRPVVFSEHSFVKHFWMDVVWAESTLIDQTRISFFNFIYFRNFVHSIRRLGSWRQWHLDGGLTNVKKFLMVFTPPLELIFVHSKEATSFIPWWMVNGRFTATEFLSLSVRFMSMTVICSPFSPTSPLNLCEATLPKSWFFQFLLGINCNKFVLFK